MKLKHVNIFTRTIDIKYRLTYTLKTKPKIRPRNWNTPQISSGLASPTQLYRRLNKKITQETTITAVMVQQLGR